jgi:hypothetical protein
LQKSFNVIPAGPVPEVSSPGAGIQVFQGPLARGCHRSDGFVDFCKRLRIDRIDRITGNGCFLVFRSRLAHVSCKRKQISTLCKVIFQSCKSC